MDADDGNRAGWRARVGDVLHAPVILQAYIVFALVATVMFFASVLPRLGATLMPYLGQSLMFYMFTVFFAVVAARSIKYRKALRGVIGLLSLAVLFGALHIGWYIWGPDSARYDFDNPYLVFHPYRPIVSVAVPLAWVMLLLSPSMRQWVRQSPDASASERRRQFSLIDLLYLIVTVAVCLALSLKLVDVVRQAKQATPPFPSVPLPKAALPPAAGSPVILSPSKAR